MNVSFRCGRHARRLLSATLAAVLTSLAVGGCHAADAEMARCAGAGQPRTLLERQGMLESLAFDAQGRLLYTDIGKSALMRLDGAAAGVPVTVAQGLSFPGGLVVLGPDEVHVGVGNGPFNGLLPGMGGAGVSRVQLSTGQVTPLFKGLAMANGLVRASDGTYYASDDLARSLDRVLPDGTVQRGWLPINSNGLVLSQDEQTLYVNQMLPAKVLAVNRATGQVRVVAEAPKNRTWTWLDGLAIDGAGRLYVVAYWGGEIWRVEPSGAMCLLASGLSMPSAVVTGRDGLGFSAGSVYVTTHSGRVQEVPGAVPPNGR